MTAEASRAPRALWHGRTLALVGIVLVALNLRTAVGALSPIFDQIAVDVSLGSIGIGLLGTLPPVSFAVVGLFAPALHRRFGLEPVVVVALAVILAGHLVRASSGSYLALVLGSAFAFAGMGVANVLLPPLVKKYFPDRIGLVTSLYATIMAIGATIPPLVAVQLADSAGWRVSVGVWSLFAVLALIPMVTLWTRMRGARTRAAAGPVHEAGADSPMADTIEHVEHVEHVGRIARSPLAWSLMLVFGLTALNAYAMFAWLPEILLDTTTVSPAEAGALLSLFSVMGLPASLLVPILAVRMRSVGPVIGVGVACYLLGYLGLLLVPGAAPWLWVALVGLGPLLFPLSLVLINLRTRSHAGSVALSSFVQSFGYGLGALGPLFVGVLHQATGSWMTPLVFLAATGLAVIPCGIVVSRGRMLEDEWHN
ncbi:MFS transporter [Herbiconiux sp. 11R-BC]|uniref:MFS transporter n=1 Tax=Herbiconiux sp. 11R-BC TaxID=3111637 RepID=UPI003C05DCB8